MCTRVVPCPQCDKKFASEASLKGHIFKSHLHNEKDFHPTKKEIHEKVKTEDGKIKYKCDICGELKSTNRSTIFAYPD